MEEQCLHIKEGYELLGISNLYTKEYAGPQEFSQEFVMCSILKDVNVIYSSTAQATISQK